MVWLNHYEDAPESWSKFASTEEAKRRGGCFTVKEGSEFNSNWIQELSTPKPTWNQFMMNELINQK